MNNAPNCLVIMYHYVRPAPPTSGTVADAGVKGLSVPQLRAQVETLLQIREPLNLDGLRRQLTGGSSLTRDTVLFTFDDGLKDHLAAARVLESFGAKGVFFVPGVVLKEPHMLPAHALHLLLSHVSDEELEAAVLRTLRENGDAPPSWDQSIATAAARMYHYEPPTRGRLKYLLNVHLPIAERDAVLDSLLEKFVGSTEDWARKWYLTAEEVRDLHERGHAIGGHGYTHEPFSRLSIEHTKQDIRLCSETLAAVLGRRPEAFSYPFGAVTPEAVAACKTNGFTTAFTTERTAATARTDPLRVPRIDTIYVDEFIREESACRL